MRPAKLSTALRAFILFLSLAAGVHAAKSVDDYVHGTAAKYIQGRLQEAGVEVEEGLRQYPDDARLKAMAAQLKKMKDQQKKDQGGQDSQGGDQNKDKQDKPDSSGQGKQDGKKDDKSDKDKQDEEKAKEEEGKDKERKKDKGDQDQQAQKPKPEEGKDGDSSGQAPAPAKPGEMSKEEAERLLNSYQDDEKREQKDMQKRYRKRVEVEEDW
jgi:Ca-activated chloride channel family protein